MYYYRMFLPWNPLCTVSFIEQARSSSRNVGPTTPKSRITLISPRCWVNLVPVSETPAPSMKPAHPRGRQALIGELTWTLNNDTCTASTLIPVLLNVGAAGESLTSLPKLSFTLVFLPNSLHTLLSTQEFYLYIYHILFYNETPPFPHQ